jgi:ubiquinone/menaquinone biosynthesis C-methylase UbiE
MDGRSRFYGFAYRVGFHPWEDLLEYEPFAARLRELFAREEEGREPPYGRALDLGCGSAVWGVELAKRGWDVTGVDMVEKALDRARERIEEANVSMKVVQGDVTDLAPSGIEPGFDLVLDTGTFHGLTREQRLAMGREVDRIATDSATVVIDAFAPRWRGPLPRGASQAEIEEAFPGWSVTDVIDPDPEPVGIAKALRFGELFYRLRRAGG